jgi:hypothetical protein
MHVHIASEKPRARPHTAVRGSGFPEGISHLVLEEMIAEHGLAMPVETQTIESAAHVAVVDRIQM